ncbi:MAG: RNA polymerase sigma factor [Planctomycetota bacterium]
MKQQQRPPEPLATPFRGDDRDLWRSKIAEVADEVGYDAMAPLFEILDDLSRTPEARRDALSTQLMELFRLHESRSCFGLLYELNAGHLLNQVAQRLRRYQSRADPSDLLQEVFFNIYRYPRRFDSSREDAFRVWTATIVRNTVLKHLRSLSRSGRAEVPFEDLSEHPETGGREPLGGVIQAESMAECRRVYVIYLHLYLTFYERLSEREKRALHLVEVESTSYRDAASELGIKLENLKMVIFRARRKIYRAMRRVFDGLPPDLRERSEGKERGEVVANATDSTASGRDDGVNHGN